MVESLAGFSSSSAAVVGFHTYGLRMKIDEDNWHDLKDKLYILQKRVKEHSEDRADMVRLLKIHCQAHDILELRSITKKFLAEIGELDGKD